MPRITTILPARNAEDTVRRAVTSTLTALPKDAELVVLNDGSTDNTPQILHSISHPRLRIIDGGGSGGVAQALTLLLAETDSEFVARMDADDICLPWRFKRAMPAFDRGADTVFSPVINLRGKSVSPRAPIPISQNAFGFHLLLTNPVSHPTMVARRAAIDKVGGYRKVPSEDYDLWLRLVTAGYQLERVHEWGLLYRIHPTQITASADWRRQSWISPEQAESFAATSQYLVGEALTRLVQIPDLEPDHARRELDLFVAAVKPKIAAFPGVQGWFLSRKLAKRLAWVEGQLAKHATLPTPAGMERRHD